MKLTAQDITSLNNILTTCAVGGVESIIIEDGYVRGVNEARTFVIISNHEVPKLPQKIGLSRLTSLKQRLELFSGNSATIIDAKESDRGEISSLDISAGRNKVQYRCTSTMLIKAPKSINDEATHKVFISKDELKLVLNAVKVMGGKTVQLVIKKDRTVSIIANDATNDAFTAVLDTPAEFVDEDQDSVVHYYHADIFLAVLRTSDFDITALQVGAAGTLTAAVNGHRVVIMPKVNDDSEEE